MLVTRIVDIPRAHPDHEAMNRLALAAAAFVVLAVVGRTVVGDDTGPPRQPEAVATSTASVDPVRPLDRDELTRQARRQAELLENAQRDLQRDVSRFRDDRMGGER